MAHTRRLNAALLVLVLAATTSARAATSCEEMRAQTGLAVAPGEGVVTIAAVDDDSPAAATGVRVGDALLQVNGAVPRSCGEYARALRDARKENRALLLLVRRGGTDVAAVVPATAWARVAPPPPALPPPAPPTVKAIVAAPPPPPLPPATKVSVDEVRRELQSLSADPPSRLAAYRKSVTSLQRQVETLAARNAAPAPVIAGLRTVVRYHDAAEIAWSAAEEQREKDHRPRHVPQPEETAVPYFGDSRAGRVIDEFSFLSSTVVREPSPNLLGESSGLWRPLEARALLWREGAAELDRLATWMDAGAR